MSEKNRFSGTLKPKKQIAGEPETLTIQPEAEVIPATPKAETKQQGRPKKGKSSNEKYTQATLYLTTELYKKLKIEAVNRNAEMSDLAETAIREYLRHLKV